MLTPGQRCPERPLTAISGHSHKDINGRNSGKVEATASNLSDWLRLFEACDFEHCTCYGLTEPPSCPTTPSLGIVSSRRLM